MAPGVFLIAGVPVTWTTHVMAACLATGGVASHRCAASLLGVDGFRRRLIEITVPRHAARSRVIVPGVRIHWSTDLHLAEAELVDSVPTTPPARLVVDLGGVVRAERYERAVDDLIARRLLSWDDAVGALVSHARRGRNGVGALRALLTERWGSEVPESVLERAFLRLLSVRGLPAPVLQHEIFDASGFVARVDAAYPDEWIVFELDSIRWHERDDVFEKDHRKRARLEAAGWRVLAFTWRMVRDEPDDVVRSVRAVLRAQRLSA